MNFMNLLIVLSVVLGLVISLPANDGGSDMNSLKDQITGIPGLDNLPISDSKIPDEAQNAMKAQCEKYGGPDAFTKVEEATKELQTCFTNLVNITQAQEEIEEAKKTGSLEVVFGKYCGKFPEFDQCIQSYVNVIELCLDPKQKEGKDIFLNATKSLSDFVCYKKGERIAMFIAEGGIECLQSKQDEIQRCANQTMGQSISNTNKTLMDAGVTGIAGFNRDSLSILKFDQKECTDIKTVQDCIVKELQGCTDPSPSNIMESLFKYIIKMTPCQSLLKQPVPSKTTKSGASSLSGAAFLVAIVSARLVL